MSGPGRKPQKTVFSHNEAQIILMFILDPSQRARLGKILVYIYLGLPVICLKNIKHGGHYYIKQAFLFEIPYFTSYLLGVLVPLQSLVSQSKFYSSPPHSRKSEFSGPRSG